MALLPKEKITAMTDVPYRLASQTEGQPFPYGFPGKVCYIEQAGETFNQIGPRDEMRAAVRRALAGSCRIFAVWPGNYRSDLFLIDDIPALASATGVEQAA